MQRCAALRCDVKYFLDTQVCLVPHPRSGEDSSPAGEFIHQLSVLRDESEPSALALLICISRLHRSNVPVLSGDLGIWESGSYGAAELRVGVQSIFHISTRH